MPKSSTPTKCQARSCARWTGAKKAWRWRNGRLDFSRQVGASLQLLHVVRTISDWLSLESEQALQEELRTEARNRIENMLKSAAWSCRCASPSARLWTPSPKKRGRKART